MKRIILLLITALSLGSCDSARKAFLRSYVMEYYDAESIELLGWPQNKEMRIMFTNYKTIGNYESTGAERKAYDALCEKHNDMTYNRNFPVWDHGRIVTSSLGIDFVSIEIVSDADFDDLHPVGESLGDIVRFSSYSLRPYVDSGYTLEANANLYGFTVIGGLLSEISSNNTLTLLGRPWIGEQAELELWLESDPTLSKTHTFTVTMTADDGRVFSDSIEMIFE